MEEGMQPTAEKAGKKEEASSEGACGLTLPDAYAKDCKKCNFSHTERATDDRPEPIKDGDFDRPQPIATELASLQGDAEVGRLCLEAAHAEITRLRNQVEQLRSEVADARKWAMQERSQRWALPEPLTDAEREVLGHEVELAEYQQRHDLVATLRGLLERLG